MSNLEVHKRIKEAIIDSEKDNYYSLNCETIAEKAKTDTRTAKKHLAILEYDGFGFFCDAKKKTYRRKRE